ncbi:MAG: DUF2617 family protein [Phycisphaerae bacterium]
MSEGMSVEQGQTKQRIDDLQFYLYQRSLHPELFRINQVKRIEQRRYTAEIWVVGLSHVVSLQYGKQCLTELITDDTEILPRAGMATSFPFRGERDHTQSFGDDLRYILSCQVERMTPNLFPSSHRDLMKYAQKRGIFMMFDEWQNDGIAPFTFVDYEAREQELHVHAFHAFPDSTTLLKTQSIFEIGPAREPNFF